MSKTIPIDTSEPHPILKFMNGSNELLIIAKGLSGRHGHGYYHDQLKKGNTPDVWTINDFPIPATTLHFDLHRNLRADIIQVLMKSLPWTNTDRFVVHPNQVSRVKGSIPFPHHLVEASLSASHPWRDIITEYPPLESGQDPEDRDERDDPFYYVASTIGFLLLLSLVAGTYDSIRVYGADFNPALRAEAGYERPNVEFILGYAHAKWPGRVKCTWESYLYTTRNHDRDIYGEL